MTAASEIGNVIGSFVGTAIAGALWLALALHSVRLRNEDSPAYVGLYRWTGEQVRTRRRAVMFVLVWGLVIFTANVLFLG